MDFTSWENEFDEKDVDALAHYGVLGMRWGRRRDRNSDRATITKRQYKKILKESRNEGQEDLRGYSKANRKYYKAGEAKSRAILEKNAGHLIRESFYNAKANRLKNEAKKAQEQENEELYNQIRERKSKRRR